MVQKIDSEDIESLAVPDNGGVYFVPALTGLGAPHWDQYARGAILGIRGTTCYYRGYLSSI
jgi:glycerol kinase